MSANSMSVRKILIIFIIYHLYGPNCFWEMILCGELPNELMKEKFHCSGRCTKPNKAQLTNIKTSSWFEIW